MLEKIQLKFARVALACSKGCPVPKLYTETGLILMPLRIMRMKVMFIFHVASLSPGTLARDMFDIERRECRGLAGECLNWLEEQGIHNIESYSKYQFRKLIKQRTYQLNKEKLLQMAEGYKKINQAELALEDFRMKNYFKELPISLARLRFKIAAQVTPRIMNNFHNVKKYKDADYLCMGCSPASNSSASSTFASTSFSLCSPLPTPTPSVDTQEHVLVCPGYADLRIGLQWSSDRDLAIYFQAVIDRRIQMEEVNTDS